MANEISYGDFFGTQTTSPTEKKEGEVSYEDFAQSAQEQPQSWGDLAKQTAAPFLMGFEKGVPFGQDISAGVGTALSYAGVGPKYVPTEGTFGERFSTAKKAHEKAYEKTAEEAPWTSAAGQLAGTVYSLPMFGAAAPVETAIAGKVVPAAEKVLGPYGEGLIDLTSQGIKGALQGSVYGLGEGETLEERLQNAKSGGEWGGIIGASLPALGKSLGISRLSPAEEAAERLGARIPASVSRQHLITRPISEALEIFPLTKGIMESSIANRQAKLGEAMIEKGGFTEGLEKHIAGGGAKKAIEDYLTSDITKGHRDLMAQKWSKVQSALGPRANIIRTPLTNTKNYLNSITPQLERLGLPTSHLETYIENANKPRGLIYRDIKQLKEAVGELLETDYFQKGRKDRVLDGIYHKLNDDLKIATERIGGPDALRAFERANDFSTKMFARREALAPLLGPGSKFSDEQVYDRILNAAHNNSDLIRRAKTIINRTDPEAWKNMTSRVAEQLGRTPKNQEWSSAKFVENYNKLSPTGKNVLFGHSGSPQRKVMEDVYAAANRYVETGKDKHYSKLTLAMVSGAAADLAAATGALSSGSWPAIAGTVIASYPIALILSQPRLAHLFSKHLSNPANEQYIKNFRNAVRSIATQMTKEHYEDQERPQRASGGKIGNRDYPARKLSRVEKALKRAQDALAMETKPIMNIPDEAVAQALHLAKDK